MQLALWYYLSSQITVYDGSNQECYDIRILSTLQYSSLYKFTWYHMLSFIFDIKWKLDSTQYFEYHHISSYRSFGWFLDGKEEG